MNELKPCPFCGGRAELCTEIREGFRTFWVSCCENCCAYTLHVSRPEVAVERWDRRVSDE